MTKRSDDSQLQRSRDVTRLPGGGRRRAAAGATVTMPAQDMFWGDRYGKVTDPFGHEWSFATHIKDLTPQEMQEAAKHAFG